MRLKRNMNYVCKSFKIFNSRNLNYICKLHMQIANIKPTGDEENGSRVPKDLYSTLLLSALTK